MRRREMIVQLPREIPVRVNQAEAESGPCILKRHVEQERRLAGASLPNDLEMREPVPQANTERLVAIPSVGQAEIGDVIEGRLHRIIV